ncbi:sucrose-6-phosphate hydrolase [Klebsiella pneumoniae subsp. ozaenae]|uniref:Sucrose-6-phosphate hydrolase n=1 Tax=Klebsiella pneumoniae subsp. ozaenae TaxID=574 RepID=A0A378BYU0_KLEPO|nr:sucrose-6-phosphate hydrolase [Klebsiella pneumoniae subsp. ozaenae]
MSLPSRLPAILQAVMQGQPQALADSHYPQWHLAPVNGLLNDPNGFCQVAGRLPPVLSVEPARLRPYL